MGRFNHPSSGYRLNGGVRVRFRGQHPLHNRECILGGLERGGIEVLPSNEWNNQTNIPDAEAAQNWSWFITLDESRLDLLHFIPGKTGLLSSLTRKPVLCYSLGGRDTPPFAEVEIGSIEKKTNVEAQQMRKRRAPSEQQSLYYAIDKRVQEESFNLVTLCRDPKRDQDDAVRIIVSISVTIGNDKVSDTSRTVYDPPALWKGDGADSEE